LKGVRSIGIFPRAARGYSLAEIAKLSYLRSSQVRGFRLQQAPNVYLSGLVQKPIRTFRELANEPGHLAVRLRFSYCHYFPPLGREWKREHSNHSPREISQSFSFKTQSTHVILSWVWKTSTVIGQSPIPWLLDRTSLIH